MGDVETTPTQTAVGTAPASVFPAVAPGSYKVPDWFMRRKVQLTFAVVVVAIIIVIVMWRVMRAPANKEHYGEPPGMLPSVWYRGYAPTGWADMPREYEGSSASAVSAYMMWSAGDGQVEESDLIGEWSQY